jgi:mannosyl-3-phosphoglycerate phosphatase
MLTSFYKKKHKDIVTIGIGDSLNDAPMLASVDLPILVKKPDGTYDADIHIPNLLKTDGIGPEGWNTIMLNLLRNNLKR